MRTRRLFVTMVALGTFLTAVHAEQAYRPVKVWPEAPLGWHFFKPNGVATDEAGNVYVADSGNYRVKKFDPEGRLISQWGSPGQADGQFDAIYGVEVDNSGTVYVLDEDYGTWEHPRIQKFTSYGQFIGTLERTTADQINLPIDLAIDGKGNVLVLAVDYRPKLNRTYGVRIEKYSPHGEFISQWGADAGSNDGQFMRPRGIAVDAKDNVYITDGDNNRVQKFDPDGKFIMTWGTQGDGEGLFSTPRSIAVGKAGAVFVLDNNSVQEFTAEGQFLARWKVKGTPGSKMAIDAHSNVYVTNESSHNVLKFDASGTVVQEWRCGGSKDDRLRSPGGIAVDQSGHVVVADVGNSRIKRFTPEGKFISQLGGNVWVGVTGLATGLSGNLYVACLGSDEIQRYNPDGRLIGRWGSTGSGDGEFRFPSAVAVGPSGNVYVADAGNCRVQKFTSEGEFLAKWGTEGTGDGQFSGPFFIEVDGSGNVWVGDRLGNGTHRMQKFDAYGTFLMKWTKKIMTPPGTGYCGAVTVDSAGNSYYAFERGIEKYDVHGELVRDTDQKEVIKNRFGSVRGICVDERGYLYVTGSEDRNQGHLSASGSIRIFDADGKLADRWASENTEGIETIPNGPITVDRTGNVYVSLLAGASVWKFSSGGKLIAKFAVQPPVHGGSFSVLGGMAVDRSGKIYAVDSVDVDWGYGFPSIKEFDANGRFIRTWEVPGEDRDKLKYPAFIAVDGTGHVYVTDRSNHCVHKFDARGAYIKNWGTKGTGDGQFDIPEGIAVGKSGSVYVCDRQNCRIQKFNSDGKLLARWGKEGSGDGEFHFPAAVAVDKEEHVFVADSDNHRVQKFTAEGRFLTEWGEFGEAPGQFNVPLGIAVDREGNVYVSDSHNHRIQKFAPASR